VIQQDAGTYSLDASVEVLWDSLNTYSISDFANPNFAAAFQAASDIDFTLVSGQYYWGKVSIENQLPASAQQYEWVLRFSNTWTDLDVFIKQADGSFIQQRNGTFVPQSEKQFFATSEGNLVKLLLQPNQPVRIYFRGKSERESIPPKFNLTLQHTDDFYAELQFRKTSTVIFIGFVLMMLIYNLMLYFFGGDRSYIYYSVYLLALVIYASFISEDLADWLEPYLFPEHPEYLYFGKLVIYMGLMSYLLFMRSFLDLGQLLAGWDRYFKWLCWLGLPLVILDVFLIFKSNFSYAVADLVTVLYILLFVLSVFAFIYPLYRTRDKKGYFIIAGIIFMGLGFLFTAIARGASPAFSLIYFKVGTVLEVIAFSLGLAYRQREIEQARQAASFELEKSKLLQQQEQAEAERLKELSQFKSRFYTNITHEFRTPLTVILGMNENIKGHEQEKKLIRRNSQNLLQLINQLLDLSKIESGNLKMNLIQGDIITYLQYLTESFYSMATEKNIRLTFYAEEESLLMDYDEVKVQHIIYNLLSNAIKFTPSMGKVILHALKVEEGDQSYLKIKVKDNGRGINAEQLPLIFDRFYQTNETSSSHQAIGSGVGLALTKELIELMGGSIEVSSTPEKGTAFTITLSIKQDAQILEPTPPKTLGAEFASADTPSGVPVNNQEKTSENHQGLNLLLIEDNPDVVTYIKSILAITYNITVATNGQTGVEQAIEQVPDIIISDVMMPEKDGYEVCETLKQDIRTSHIPIILLTAKATADDRVQGLKYGADAYLTKPFNKEELFVRLEKLTELRKQLQTHYSFGISAEVPQIENDNLENEFLQKLKVIIHENISKHQFGVPELAAEMAMSHSQVYRKLKAITGETPSSLIRQTRLKEGLRLLKTTDLNISEIAYDVGFSDPNYFSRAFNDAFGTSPRDARNK
jgi:signal transduction histidine kinase/DNA-binding response OmpR family regulator